MDYENPYASPLADTTTGAERQHAVRKDLGWLLFSFEGRIPRRSYWAVSIISWLVIYAILLPATLLGGDQIVFILLLLVLFVPSIWISLAILVKRWHDRDKSGWWVLIGLIPYVGGIWTLIECGCLRGTMGPNFYGEDPT